MSKYRTYPTIFDDAYQIEITKLKEWGYLTPGQVTQAKIKWSLRGEETAVISILIDMNQYNPFIELNYKCNDKPYKYKVFLTSSKSNLNKGQYFYFLCPVTKKKCRKLYLVNEIFAHREAFKGCLYYSQNQSKKTRVIIKSMDSSFKLDDLYSKIYNKNFRKEYSGKPTRKYLRLLKKIRKYEAQRNGYLNVFKSFVF